VSVYCQTKYGTRALRALIISFVSKAAAAMLIKIVIRFQHHFIGKNDKIIQFAILISY